MQPGLIYRIYETVFLTHFLNSTVPSDILRMSPTKSCFVNLYAKHSTDVDIRRLRVALTSGRNYTRCDNKLYGTHLHLGCSGVGKLGTEDVLERLKRCTSGSSVDVCIVRQ